MGYKVVEETDGVEQEYTESEADAKIMEIYVEILVDEARYEAAVEQLDGKDKTVAEEAKKYVGSGEEDTKGYSHYEESGIL